jgi:hypothetical protein
MRPKGRHGQFITDNEHRLDQGLALGLLIEGSPTTRCRVGNMRLNSGATPDPLPSFDLQAIRKPRSCRSCCPCPLRYWRSALRAR